jgi:hypothetical protein
MAALTVTTQNVWPPRRLITASGLGDEFYTIYRVVGGQRTPLRAAVDILIYPTPVFVVVDSEFPFAVPVTYVLVDGAGNVEDTEGPATVDLPGGNVALTDAITGLAAEVQIGTIDDLAATTNSTVYEIDGLNHVVGAPQSPPQTIIEYFTATLTARDNLRALLRGATTNIYQQRGPNPSYDVEAYYAILGSRERRFSQDGTDERRITAVTVAQVTGWPAGLEATGFTYQDVADAYAGLTYADLAGDYATYLAVAQGDYS